MTPGSTQRKVAVTMVLESGERGLEGESAGITGIACHNSRLDAGARLRSLYLG